MSESIRLRLSFVFLALLPGLLFQAGESLSVCLHDWIDFEDGCQEALAEAAESTASESCCSEGRSTPEGPDLASGHECGGCCFELGSERADVSTPPPAADAHSLCPAAPMHEVAARYPAAPARRLTTPRVLALARKLPGHAPTPLRI